MTPNETLRRSQTDTPGLFDGRVMICDGAMGTMLNAAGFPLNGALCELSLSRPEVVAAVHQAYIDAGAEVIETNSFLASRTQLSHHGLEGRVREINLAAARVARDAAAAADRQVFVAGSVGPATNSVSWRRADPVAVRDAFREQIAALVEGGVDLIIFETFGGLAELTEAIAAAHEVTLALPLVAQMYFLDNGRSLAGERPSLVAASLDHLGLAAIGANCLGSLEALLKVLTEMAGHTSLPLTAQPNAGTPALVNGRLRYSALPDEYAAYAARYAEAGAALVGGCCGTTPAHIRAATRALGLTPPA
ncbi:MAG TPA: homocysteine S-methyltransferase family protein [Dehalococcoidia bacterium]